MKLSSVDDQYQPAGYEPLSSNPPIAETFSKSILSSRFVGIRQSWCPYASSFAAYFIAALHFIVSGASAGVVYRGLPVSGDTPAKIVPSAILSPGFGSAFGAASLAARGFV